MPSGSKNKRTNSIYIARCTNNIKGVIVLQTKLNSLIYDSIQLD